MQGYDIHTLLSIKDFVCDMLHEDEVPNIPGGGDYNSERQSAFWDIYNYLQDQILIAEKEMDEVAKLYANDPEYPVIDVNESWGQFAGITQGDDEKSEGR